MAPRSSWKGFLKLSLVSVPVKAYTAHDTSEEVHLNQLHKSCNSRIRYQKVCPEHGELKSDEIVSGYEFAKDQYVVIDPEEIAKLRSESDKSIHIDGFVKADAVDPIYHAGKTYYLLPDGVAGNRPYSLLLQGMVQAGVQALAHVVLTGREQLVLVRPVENLLAITVLHYAKSVKGFVEFRGDAPQEAAAKDELALAKTLIQASTLERFDLSDYPNTYVENLTKMIRMKIDGEEIVQAPEPETPKILNLMDALKKSVAEAQAGAPRKMAPSVPAAGRGARRRKAAGAEGRKRG